MISDAMEFMTAVTVMFVLSIPVAFVTNWALLCWVLLPVVRAAVRLAGRRINAAA
ncbi:hypothetical protein [Kutzneria sp. NPDC052558]|uniref:hypothetical protein n=1 Tax=Kutzneria sp. NPDC052558 TaxID=3364121 RepID=UPI0037C68E9E